jgi:hypothetical protein
MTDTTGTTADELLAAVQVLSEVERAVLVDRFTQLADEFAMRDHYGMSTVAQHVADLAEDRTAGALLSEYRAADVCPRDRTRPTR